MQEQAQPKPYAGMAISDAIRAVDARIDLVVRRQTLVANMCVFAVLISVLALGLALAAWVIR